MGYPITEQEFRWVQELEEAKVLESFKPSVVNEPFGLIHCADGQECPELLKTILTAAEAHQVGKTNVSLFGWYGGVLSIHPDSPSHDYVDQREVTKAQLDMLEEGGCKRLIVVPHLHCKWTRRSHHLAHVRSFWNYLAHTALVKQYLKETRPFKVGMLCQMRLPDARLYQGHFKLKPWQAYCHRIGRNGFFSKQDMVRVA